MNIYLNRSLRANFFILWIVMGGMVVIVPRFLGEASLHQAWLMLIFSGINAIAFSILWLVTTFRPVVHVDADLHAVEVKGGWRKGEFKATAIRIDGNRYRLLDSDGRERVFPRMLFSAGDWRIIIECLERNKSASVAL